ncbi:MAG: TonB-dependent siderophore receptor [Pseudomonadota bacterium]
MKNLPQKLIAAASIGALTATPISVAQNMDDEVSVQDEIVVVGQYLYTDQINALKAPTPIIDVPQSLSIVTADQILERGFDSIGDVINYIPGVTNSQGEGHRDAIVFRGVRSTADFFVDGVRDDVQYYRSLYNLEQVEILRGPNALLFGRGGTGGVLNRVTKKGVIGDRFNGYQAGVDSFGGFDVALDSNFDVSDNAAIRINAYYESLENHRDFYDGDNYGINPTARIALSPATTLDLSYEYANHERFIDRGIPTGDNGEPVEALKDITFGDPDLNTAEFEAHILRANVQHTFNENLKGNVTVAYGDYDKLYQNFYASGYTQSTNIVQLDGYVDTTQRQRFTLAGNLVSEFETGSIGHTIIGGVEFLDTSNDNDRFNPVFSSTGNDRETFLATRPLNFRNGAGVNAAGDAVTMTFSDINDRNEAEVQVTSFYVQDQIEVNQYVDILLGARFDSFEIDVTDTEDPTAPISRSRTDEEISPRLGVIVKPQENISLYASYSESFLPRSGGQYASLSDSTEQLDPDIFEQAEIGVKWDFFERLSLTAAYFQNEQTRTQRNQDDDGFETARGLKVDGFEVQLQGELTDYWFISAGYSNLSGETSAGAEPRELPEQTFSIWNNFEVNEKLGFGIGATYQDEALIRDGSTLTLPSFTRVDAAAYYDFSDDLRIQLNVENLTDEVYFPTSHSTHQATVGAPLNAKVKISGKF